MEPVIVIFNHNVLGHAWHDAKRVPMERAFLFIYEQHMNYLINWPYKDKPLKWDYLFYALYINSGPTWFCFNGVYTFNIKTLHLSNNLLERHEIMLYGFLLYTVFPPTHSTTIYPQITLWREATPNYWRDFCKHSMKSIFSEIKTSPLDPDSGKSLEQIFVNLKLISDNNSDVEENFNYDTDFWEIG